MLKEKPRAFLTHPIAGVSVGKIIYLLSRVSLGIIFLIAASSKVTALSEFQKNVASYHMVPTTLLPGFSFILPFLELLIGIYLVLGIFEKITAGVTIVLLCVFMIAITYAILTNQPVSGCGCFSQSAGSPVGWIDIVRDIFFLAEALIVFFFSDLFLSADTYIQKINKKSA